MRHAVYVAPFGPLADPHRLMELATAVERHGWDGLYLWDHVLRPETRVIIDPWVAMAAMATVTERIRLGPMVTPLSRRRLVKLAREVVTLDLLSRGRITLGLGLGVDSGGELTRLGEVVEPRDRGAILDEGSDVLAALLAGERVRHRGRHHLVDDVVLEPRPIQRPRPPIWCAAVRDADPPVRRAARFDGIFPIDIGGARFDRILELVASLRGSLDGFDVCVRAEPDGSPPDYAERGATWMVVAWPAVVDLDELHAAVEAGPSS
ncbi:MAG: LLM class flavin-dependent oxidoreductase [Acidimicrobiales bacterium]